MSGVTSIAGTAARAAAIVIAIAAAADPAITSARTGKPSISVVAADSPRDSILAERVIRVLSNQFVIYRSPMLAVDGAVLVGNALPRAANEMPAPAFAVLGQEPGVSIEAVRVPESAPAGSRVPVEPSVRVAGARGRTLELILRADGLVVDRVTRTVSSDDELVHATLFHVPSSNGTGRLRATAILGGATDTAAVDMAVDVRDDRWPVLFFDARPSWMSTFVRRAVERDPRFVVTSRVVTSRNLSTDAGGPPARISDLASMRRFDAVVVGAPESLSEADVDGLDAYMRRRGGSVVLLLDRRAPGAYERLVAAGAVGAWASDSVSRSVMVRSADGDTSSLRASELAYPRNLPVTATMLAATIGAGGGDSPGGRPAIWRAPVGAGRLVVSGALDAWRYRDQAVSGFDRFWQTTLGEAAAASPPPVSIRLSRRVARPWEDVNVSVTVRDAALSESPRASVEARLESDSQPTIPIRLWPDAVGAFAGTVRAPGAGTYRVVVASEGARVTSPLVVLASAARPTPDDRDLVGAWVRARGGRTVESSRLVELPAIVTGAVRAAPRAETWHPMRSAWWIVPFALLLGTDWWLRTRSAQRNEGPVRILLDSPPHHS